MVSIGDLLALPGEDSIQIRVGANLDAVVFINRAKFEAAKESVREFCLGLELEPATLNWRALRRHVEDNGTYAKILISLGHIAGAWTAHPRPEDSYTMWNSESPRVLQATLPQMESSRVPKPSRGDLDPGVPCDCCARLMGPVESRYHDLVASSEEADLCVECAIAGCIIEHEHCNLQGEKRAEARYTKPEDPDEEKHPPHDEMAAYLELFK